MEKKIIGFHDADKEYGFMSNWYLSDFELEGIRFSSVEQYIMYNKSMLFNDPEHAREILATDKVDDIQKIGRKVKNYSDSIWAGNRQIIAYQGLMAKFTQNSDLAKALLDTGDAILCECAGSDRIWGIGLKTNDERYLDMDQWCGQNLLGFTLMQVRDQLAREIQNETAVYEGEL